MPSPYDYATSAGPARARADWLAGLAGATQIRSTDLDRWDQSIYDLKLLTFNVKDFGAVGNGTTDDVAAIQAAINAAVAAGGGIVYFPYTVGGYRLTATGTRYGQTWHLTCSGDNITFQGAPGATLLTTVTTDQLNVFFTGGSGKVGAGFADFLLGTNNYFDWTGTDIPGSPPTLHNLVSGPYAKGSMSLTLASGQGAASGLAAGDYVFIKTGQVIEDTNNPAVNHNPDAELNQVAGRSGDVLSLYYPTSKPYAQEYWGPASTITGATNANPIVITAVAHGFSNGNRVNVVGVLGNTNANGTYIIANKTNDTFELVGRAGNAAWSAGGTQTVAEVGRGPTTTTVNQHPAPFGVTKVTDRTSKNLAWRGLRLESTSPNITWAMYIDQIWGVTIEDCEFVGMNGNNSCCRRVRIKRNRVLLNRLNPGAWPVTVDKGCVDYVIEDNDFANAADAIVIHLNEGSAQIDILNNRIYSKAVASAQAVISVNGRAYDHRYDGNLIVNSSTDGQAIGIGGGCDGGGVISNNVIRGTYGASIYIGSPGWHEYGNSSDLPIFDAGQTTSQTYRLSGIIEHNSGSAVAAVTLGTIPAYALVTNALFWIDTAFNSSGTDLVSVGRTGNQVAYLGNTDVSSVSPRRVVPVINTGDGWQLSGSPQVATIYYTPSGSQPTAGRVRVIVEYAIVQA